MTTESFDNGVKISQYIEGYHFTSDALALAKWITLKKSARVLEMCAGSGVISIYASYGIDAEIDFVELQSQYDELLSINIMQNNIKGNIHIIDIKEYDTDIRYDDIIVNPPFERVCDNSKVQHNDTLALSRHEISIDMESIIAAAKRVSKYRTNFWIVHRVDRMAEIIHTLHNYGFVVKNIHIISPHNKQPHLVLIKAVYGAKNGVIVTTEERE